jgi:LysM repeat protein
VIVGLYHFGNGGDPTAEANYFCSQANVQPGEFVVLDWESSTANPPAWGETFLARVQALTGAVGIEYLNLSEINGYNWSPVINANHGLWLAYPDGSTATFPATPWPFVAFKQYSWSGSVPGVAGQVDLDVFNGTLAQLEAYTLHGTAPTPTPVPAPTPAPVNNYVAQRGDSMSSIAAAHGMSLATLESYNPQIANFNLIYVGEVIHLGTGNQPAYNTYRVVSGDTLSGIAARFGLSLGQIEAMNPQLSGNYNLLQIGEVINV